MSHGRNKKNFEVFDVDEFIAAVTQHIPEKSFQMIRYYGWYSNRSRGDRRKRGFLKPGDESPEAREDITVLDVSDYKPRRIPSKTWRELIKKVWEYDPLICNKCGAEMKIIALIHDHAVISRILKHLGLWKIPKPKASLLPDGAEPWPDVVYEEEEDCWPVYEEPTFQYH